MSLTIQNAISIDGFIAGPNDDTAWVSEADWNTLEKTLEEFDIILMGSKTYEVSLEGDGCIPYGTKPNVVLTSRINDYSDDRVTFTNKTPEEFVEENLEKKILCIGGGKLNTSLLKAKLVDELLFSIHPIILGSGTRQFEGIDFSNMTNLTKVSEKDIGDGVVLIHYKVI